MTKTETRTEKLQMIEEGMNNALDQLTEARRNGNQDAIEYWGGEADRFAHAKAQVLWA